MLHPQSPNTAASTKSDRRGSGRELTFRGSPGPTVGIELELPVLDRDSGELVPGAPLILQACAEEKLPGTAAELMQSMLELRTGVCQNVAEAQEQLTPTLRRVRTIATSMGYDLALLGTHPFLKPGASAIAPHERYERVLLKLAWMTYYRVAFGLHIHVGVGSGDEAVGVVNRTMQYLPHLLALSANSPFWQGVDTGLVSCRASLYGLVPRAGVPFVFSRWKEFRNYYQVMYDCRALSSPKDVKWDIRPRPDLGTVEFRICDMPMSLKTVWALAALTRAIVVATTRLLHERPQLRRGDRRRQWITVENKALAGRHGLKAIYIRTPGGKRRALGDDVADLVERLTPIATELGDDKLLTPFRRIDRFESGAAFQRQVYRETGSWQELLGRMREQLASELSKGKPKATTAPAHVSGNGAGRGTGHAAKTPAPAASAPAP